MAYYLGIGNLLYGVGSDIKSENSMFEAEERGEHIRRLGEFASIMLDAGNILIVTANELSIDEIDTLRRIITIDNVLTVLLGESESNVRDFDLCIDENDASLTALYKKIIENSDL